MENTAVSTDRNRSARRRQITVKVLQYLLLTALAVFLCLPFLFMVFQSVMPESQFQAGQIFPTSFTGLGYVKLFSEHNYLTYFLNTLVIVGFNVIAMPLASSFCAYSFARLKWRGKELVFACVLSTLMIPGVVTQIPLFLMFSSWRWINTPWPLTIPTLFGGGAINIFLFRQFMRGIPIELEEAAKIDGANAFRRWFSITLPLCVPILLFVAVGAFGSSWGDYFQPLFYYTDPDKYTLAVAIYKVTVLDGVSENSVVMAAGVFMSILPALIFFFLQRKLIDGITVGAVKE